MTSSYTETITKLKNALENVFVKKVDVKNNLTSTDTNKPLSANQGKILDENKVDKVSGKGLSTNDFNNTYKGKLDDLDSNLSNKANSTHTHGNLQNDGQVGSTAQPNYNVVTDENGKIITEAKPTIPSASSTTPSADTQNGSYGSGTDYARANHTHPKSSLYAESSHTHTIGDIGATSEILEVTLWEDDGSYVYMLDYYLAYDSSENKIYYNGTSPTNEITTKEDINEAIIYTMGYADMLVGNAITYINQ